MPTPLADIVSQITIEANKGGFVSRQIPYKLREAIAWLEQNHSLRYMKTFKRFKILAGGLEPGPYALVPNYKSMRFVRLVLAGADGGATYQYLTKCEAEDLAGVGRCAPKYYWVDDEWVWFDSIPSEELSAQLMYYRYTGALVDTDTHWLFDNAVTVLIAKTMLLLMPTARQPLWEKLYTGALEQGMRTLLLAEEESQVADTDLRMGMTDRG